MNVVDVRSLLNEEIRIIPANDEFVKMFNQYCKLRKERSEKPMSDFEYFYAGWILANPQVREVFHQVREKEIKYDSRIQNELWRRS